MMAFSVAQLESSLRTNRCLSDAFIPESGDVLPYAVSMLGGQVCSDLGEIFVLDAPGHVERDLDHLLKRNRDIGLKALKLYSDRRRRIPVRLIRQIVRFLNSFVNEAS